MRIPATIFGRIPLTTAARLLAFRCNMSPPGGTSVNSPVATGTDCGVLFSFGLLADVHYADVSDGFNYSKTRMRYYRNSLSLLSDAVRHWNNRRDVSFVLQLGDLIDGCNKGKGASEVSLQTTLDICAKFNGPFYHIWGNHELYNFTKDQLAETPLNSSRDVSLTSIVDNSREAPISDGVCNYYHFSPMRGFRIVAIDTYDVGVLGGEPTRRQFVEAERLLASKNPNEDKNSHVGLPGLDARFVMYNGGVGPKQLQWLREVIGAAHVAKEKVLIIGHIPLFVDSSTSNCICWNYDEVLDVIHSFPQCTAAYLCGHDHDGGQAIDAHGVLHITVQGVIETPPGGRAFATVHVHSDKIVVDGGGGRVISAVINL